MSTLTIIQTIFYLLSSIAILAVGIMVVIVLYYLLGILRNTKHVSDDLTETYTRTKRHIKKIINSVTKNKKNEKSE